MSIVKNMAYLCRQSTNPAWCNHKRKTILGETVSAGIAAMTRVKPFVPLSTLKMLCNAIVQAYVDYCSPLWDNSGMGLKDRLQNNQNWAARVLSGTVMILGRQFYLKT